eukprot:1188964-Prorocentrum_minimum.AAC.2
MKPPYARDNMSSRDLALLQTLCSRHANLCGVGCSEQFISNMRRSRRRHVSGTPEKVTAIAPIRRFSGFCPFQMNARID